MLTEGLEISPNPAEPNFPGEDEPFGVIKISAWPIVSNNKYSQTRNPKTHIYIINATNS